MQGIGVAPDDTTVIHDVTIGNPAWERREKERGPQGSGQCTRRHVALPYVKCAAYTAQSHYIHDSLHTFFTCTCFYI